MKLPKESSIEVMLAWRNVWKNKRRTVLTLLTIMVGCAMIIFSRAFQDGRYGQMIEDSVAANTGHIQIHEKGFWENQSIDYAFKPDEAVMSYLRKTPQCLPTPGGSTPPAWYPMETAPTGRSSRQWNPRARRR